MGKACTTYGRHEKCIQSSVRKYEGKYHLGDLGKDGSIILKYVLNKV
jgi:hypothetical protein